LPVALFLKYGDSRLKMINKLLMRIQYIALMCFFFVMFVGFSCVLLPFAWVFSVLDKFKKIG